MDYAIQGITRHITRYTVAAHFLTRTVMHYVTSPSPAVIIGKVDSSRCPLLILGSIIVQFIKSGLGGVGGGGVGGISLKILIIIIITVQIQSCLPETKRT